jgi:hypothetical protein
MARLRPAFDKGVKGSFACPPQESAFEVCNLQNQSLCKCGLQRVARQLKLGRLLGISAAFADVPNRRTCAGPRGCPSLTGMPPDPENR